MANRIFTQQGQAYGSSTARLIATLDGVEVYSGPVNTIDSPLPPQPGTKIDEDLFSWTQDAGFQGTKTLGIAVTGADLIIADVLANMQEITFLAGSFGLQYSQNIDGVTVQDCFTNVMIDGIPYQRGSSPTGQWYWTLNAGQTFQATINIQAGINPSTWDPGQSYQPGTTVLYDNTYYCNNVVASAGVVPPDNQQVWFAWPLNTWQSDQSYAIYTRVFGPASQTVVYTAIQNVPQGITVDNTAYWQAFTL